MKKLKYTDDSPFRGEIYQDIITRSVFSKAEVRGVRILKGGIINKNYELSLINPDIRVNLRIYSGEDAENRANKERIVYDLTAKNTDVPVPTIYTLDSSRAIINGIFVLQSVLPGINLATICSELSSEERQNVASQIGEYLGQLHTICFPKFGDEVSENGIGDKLSWREFFMEFTLKNISWCEEYGVIDDYLADSIKEHIAKWQWLLSIEQPAVLVHRDFHLGNIKVQKGQKGHWEVSGIYDFEHAIAGHNEFDFAKPYWAIFQQYSDMKEPMLWSYRQISSLSPLFDLRINRLYRLAEITDFLVFGTTHNMVSEVAKNILSAKEILRKAI